MIIQLLMQAHTDVHAQCTQYTAKYNYIYTYVILISIFEGRYENQIINASAYNVYSI